MSAPASARLSAGVRSKVSESTKETSRATSSAQQTALDTPCAVLTHRLVATWGEELGIGNQLPRIRNDDTARSFLQARGAIG